MLRETGLRARLPDSLVASLGFCALHTRQIRSMPTAQAALQPCITHAALRLVEALGRTKLQDEFLQDVLFSARSRCPICAFVKQLDGRLIARVLYSLEVKQRTVRETILTGLCFEHSRAIAMRSNELTRRRVLNALRIKQHALLAQGKCLQAGSSDDAPDACAHAAVHRLIYPEAPVGFFNQYSTSRCKVCEDLLRARAAWYSVAIQNLQLGLPGWLTLPTCTVHAIEYMGGPCFGLRYAAFIHYVEHAPLEHVRRPAATHVVRRPRHRWFDKATAEPVTGRRGEKHEQPTRIALGCPNCRISSTAEKRSVLAVIDMLQQTSDTVRQAVTQHLCLKHFAEVLILTGDNRSQAIALEDLRRLLLSVNRIAATPMPFGTDT